jgi:hypothetical protein
VSIPETNCESEEDRRLSVCRETEASWQAYEALTAYQQAHDFIALDEMFGCAVFCGLMQYHGLPVYTRDEEYVLDNALYRKWQPFPNDAEALFCSPWPPKKGLPIDRNYAFENLLLRVNIAEYGGNKRKAISRLTWDTLLSQGALFHPVMAEGANLIFEVECAEYDGKDHLNIVLPEILRAFDDDVNHVHFSAARTLGMAVPLIPIVLDSL